MNTLLSILNKAVPGGGVLPGDAPELIVRKESTGVSPLDLILGGGLPRRRITLLMGAEGHGKSFVAHKLVAAFQQRGLSTVYVDVEKAFEPEWAVNLGIDLKSEKLVVAQPPAGEKAVNIVAEALKAGVDLVIVDSIASLVPTKLLESEAEDIFVGLLARLVNPAIGRWQQLNEHSVLLLINQIRDVIGTPIHEERVPGGRMQTYASSLTLRVRRHGWLTEKNKRIGFPMFFRVEKTKIPGVIPWSSCEVPFLFNGSLDVIEALVTTAVERGFIRQEGPHYFLGDEKIYGRNNVVTLFRENPELVEALLKEAKLEEGENAGSMS